MGLTRLVLLAFILLVQHQLDLIEFQIVGRNLLAAHEVHVTENGPFGGFPYLLKQVIAVQFLVVEVVYAFNLVGVDKLEAHFPQ